MRTKTTSLMAMASLLAGSTNAAVTSFLDQDIPISTDFEGVSLDLETGATSSSLEGLSGGDLNIVFGGLGISNDGDENALAPTWQPVRVGTGNTDVLENLGLGVEVGPTLTFSTGFGGSADNFTNFVAGEKGYVGFSLELADATVAYGWMEVTFENNDAPGVIHSWAFDTSGAPLEVGAIPEPTQSVMLVLGIAAGAMRRRRS